MALADPSYAHDPNKWGARGYILGGLMVIIGLFGGLLFWSMSTELHGAIIAPGELRVETSAKPIQHHEGGIVSAIYVKDGDFVKVGDLLVGLDPTMQEASFEIVDAQLIESLASKARFLAERDEQRDVTFSNEVLERAGADPEIRKIAIDQRNLFIARLESFFQQNQQLRERVGQLQNEISAAQARRAGYVTQRVSMMEELAAQDRLMARGLTTRSRVQEFRRELARIDGEIGAFDADVARLRRQIQETQIEMTRMRETRREEAISQLREVEAQIVELRQRMIVAKDALKKIELRAPHDGVVQDMAIYAPGAVVGPAEELMTIIPTSDRLILTAKIQTNKRDQLRIDGEARVRFTAFNQRTTPELNGIVSNISYDRKVDEQDGSNYYEVEILVPEEERERLSEENVLVPGLPAEIYIQTDSRTPLNYLLKPILDNFNRAGRER